MIQEKSPFKNEEIALNKKLILRIVKFLKETKKTSTSANEFIMSFDTSEKMEEISDLMALYVKSKLRNYDFAFYLPVGELGLLFRNHIQLLIDSEIMPSKKWRKKVTALNSKIINKKRKQLRELESNNNDKNNNQHA